MMDDLTLLWVVLGVIGGIGVLIFAMVMFLAPLKLYSIDKRLKEINENLVTASEWLPVFHKILLTVAPAIPNDRRSAGQPGDPPAIPPPMPNLDDEI